MKGVTVDGEDDATGATPPPTPIRPPGGPQGGHATVRPPGAGRDDLVQAIGLLRARVEEEFRITERLDAKARQAFAMAAGFFVVAQTVAFGSFAQDSVTGAPLVILGVLALIAGGWVAATGHQLAHGEDLLEVEDIRPDAVVEWCDDATDDDYVSVRIVGNLRDVAKDRHANNTIRERNYERVNTAMRWALIFASVELAVAILVRL